LKHEFLQIQISFTDHLSREPVILIAWADEEFDGVSANLVWHQAFVGFQFFKLKPALPGIESFL
jgi:hypothetical protein